MYVFYLIAGISLLIAGGEFLVRGAVGLAKKFKISMLVIGLTVVAFGTSAPELVISLTAALKGLSSISVGNIIGSNIYNISLVLGVSTIIFAIPAEKQSIRIDWPVMMIASLLFFGLALDGSLSFLDGLMLFTLLIAFIVYVIRKSRKEHIEVEEDNQVKPNLAKDSFFVIIGSIALMYGADLFLDGSVVLAKNVGMSDRVIGLTVVALGTSMPELVTSVIAAFKKQADISIGNLIGSNIFNLLAVGGITAMIKPIVVEATSMNYDAIWMIGISAVLLPMMLIGKKIGPLKGSILLILFIVYTISLF